MSNDKTEQVVITDSQSRLMEGAQEWATSGASDKALREEDNQMDYRIFSANTQNESRDMACIQAEISGIRGENDQTNDPLHDLQSINIVQSSVDNNIVQSSVDNTSQLENTKEYKVCDINSECSKNKTRQLSLDNDTELLGATCEGLSQSSNNMDMDACASDMCRHGQIEQPLEQTPCLTMSGKAHKKSDSGILCEQESGAMKETPSLSVVIDPEELAEICDPTVPQVHVPSVREEHIVPLYCMMCRRASICPFRTSKHKYRSSCYYHSCLDMKYPHRNMFPVASAKRNLSHSTTSDYCGSATLSEAVVDEEAIKSCLDKWLDILLLGYDSNKQDILIKPISPSEYIKNHPLPYIAHGVPRYHWIYQYSQPLFPHNTSCIGSDFGSYPHVIPWFPDNTRDVSIYSTIICQNDDGILDQLCLTQEYHYKTDFKLDNCCTGWTCSFLHCSNCDVTSVKSNIREDFIPKTDSSFSSLLCSTLVSNSTLSLRPGEADLLGYDSSIWHPVSVINLCQHQTVSDQSVPEQHYPLLKDDRTPPKSPISNKQKTTSYSRPGIASDSAYASLERIIQPLDYFSTGCNQASVHTELDCVRLTCVDREIDRDSGTEECSSSTDTDDTILEFDPYKYTRDKLKQRSNDMLTVLKEQFTKLIQDVSEQLVQLLQERHELREQVEMRKIAIEQLVRFQSETMEHDSVQMSVVFSDEEE